MIMEQIKKYEFIDNEFYDNVRKTLEQARKRVYRNAQSEMVTAYWHIGKMIVERQGGDDRAKYGDNLIKELSIKLTNDFGKGFTISNLKNMRKFYRTFKKSHTVCGQLSWSQIRLLIMIDDENARNFYIRETLDGNWSVRQLEREINTFSYQRYIASHGNHDVVQDTATRELPSDPQSIIKNP